MMQAAATRAHLRKESHAMSVRTNRPTNPTRHRFVVRRAGGFTLIELLVVITIIGILMSLLLPAVNRVRETARRMECANNVRQIVLAMKNYETTLKTFPPGRVGCDGINNEVCNGVPAQARVGTGGFVTLLPYIEQQALYDIFDFRDGPWRDNTDQQPGGTAGWWNRAAPAVATVLPMYRCPTDDSDRTIVQANRTIAIGSYAMVMGTNGPSRGLAALAVKLQNNGTFMYVNARREREILDGLSNTIFVGEVVEGHTPNSLNRWTVGSRHRDSLRSTENPLNTPPGEGIVHHDYNDPIGGQQVQRRTSGAFGSKHTGGANFAFGDGRTVFLVDTIDLEIYRALSTRAGREVVQLP